MRSGMFGCQPMVRVGIVENSGFGIRLIGDYDINAGDDFVSYTPTSHESYAEISGVEIGKDFHWRRIETQRFNGLIMVKKNGSGKTSLINIIPSESYLKSVISSEMNSNSHLEFLKAHAIISRSWLMRMLQNRRCECNCQTSVQDNTKYIAWTDVSLHNDFDVCADDHCQRYQGLTRISDSAVKAVDATKGIVMVDNSGEIVDARFSKCCGGRTERFSSCWQDKDYDYLQMIEDKFCDPSRMSESERNKIFVTILNDYDAATTDFYRWKTDIFADEIKDNLKNKFGINVGEILSLTPMLRGDSGRIVELKIEGSKSNVTIGKELSIRKLLSNTHLYSSAFDIIPYETVDGKMFQLHGQGWGHGVGLCQIGAAVMAERGYSCHDILKYYYKGINFETIY